MIVRVVVDADVAVDGVVDAADQVRQARDVFLAALSRAGILNVRSSAVSSVPVPTDPDYPAAAQAATTDAFRAAAGEPVRGVE